MPSTPPSESDPASTTQPASPLVLQEWRNRVAAEYRSAALAAQILHWMIQAGFPDELLDTALRIVRDELDHAALSHDCLRAVGGEDEPVPLDVNALQHPPSDEGVLAQLVDGIGRSFCLGETFAVPLFDAMRRETVHPAALPSLERILRDEAVHRAFGWQALDVLLEMDPDGVRARLEQKLPGWLDGFAKAYASGREAVPLSPEERALGLLDGATYAEVHDRCLRQDIGPRLAARGLRLPGEDLHA